MATEPGTVGSNVGPTPGASPPDDADLHQGQNPYGTGLGSPPFDLARPLSYGQGVDAVNVTAQDTAKQTPYDVSAPYFRNPPAGGMNPHAATGAPTRGEAGDQRAAADAAGTLDRLYDDILRERQPGNDSRGGTWADGSAQEPNLADIYRDEGFGRSGEGQS